MPLCILFVEGGPAFSALGFARVDRSGANANESIRRVRFGLQVVVVAAGVYPALMIYNFAVRYGRAGMVLVKLNVNSSNPAVPVARYSVAGVIFRIPPEVAVLRGFPEIDVRRHTG